MFSSFRTFLRGLVLSLLPTSFTKNILGSVAGSMAVPVLNLPMAIIIWVELVMALLCPWNDESKNVWGDLLGYRINKAYLCKNKSGSEHEFIVVDLSNGQKRDLLLRIERSLGERKDSQAAPASSSITSIESGSHFPLSPSSPRSASPISYQSKSSPSISSVNQGLSKATDTLRRAVRRLSENPLPCPSVIGSNKHVAADSVTSINSFPKDAKIIRTINFHHAEHSQRPSLWDLMILGYVIHQGSTTYDLLNRQCFWFADTISGILEKWSETCKGSSVNNMSKARFFRPKRSSSTPCGSVKGISIHQRNCEEINKIWAQFLTQKEEMNKRRQAFEDTQTQRAKETEELAGQVEELRHQQDQERQRWEQERKEWQEREFLLMKEQEEREHLLKQQIAEQERIQQRLQQQLLENDRRFQEIDQKVQVA